MSLHGGRHGKAIMGHAAVFCRETGFGNAQMNSADFLVVGAGVVGLTVARELKQRYPDQSVLVIEKEASPGLHSSGRNSGVLHSGVYYPASSLKAQVCGQGAREMADYCLERGLALNRIGKLLIPVRAEDDAQLDVLSGRAQENKIVANELNEKELREIEPEVRSATGRALFVASTSVVDARQVMNSLTEDVRAAGVHIITGARLNMIDHYSKNVRLASGKIDYGHLINAAGLHADRIAHMMGVGHRYTLLPFKGIYWKLRSDSGISVRHLVYPVPDLRVPFLGVHTTNSTAGATYLGPTAAPAFGRENYKGWEGVTPRELVRIAGLLAQQYVAGRDGFRRLTWQEGRRLFKPWFVEAAQALLPRLRAEHLECTDKVGIRAQLLDKDTGKLVTDFLVERGPSSTHILNAISPAFTSAFPFARHVVETFFRSSHSSDAVHR